MSNAQGIQSRIAAFQRAPVRVAQTDRGLVRMVENSDAALFIAGLEAENAALRRERAEQLELVNRNRVLNELAEGYLDEVRALESRERKWENEMASDRAMVTSLEHTIRQLTHQHWVDIGQIEMELLDCTDRLKSQTEEGRILEQRLSERTTEVSNLQRHILELELKHRRESTALQAVKAAVLDGGK